MALTRIFEPISIGQVRIPNRIVRTAHDTGFGAPDLVDDHVAYNAARATGGCGLTILEASSVHRSSRLHVALFRDEIVPALRRLMDAVAPHGMRVVQQLWHGGNLYPAFDGGPPWAVSDVPGHLGLVGEVMRRQELDQLRDAFVTAALNCQAGGIDGVEIHACHGYLFHQFLAEATNTRADEYGGSFDNRTRFLAEVLQAIRRAVRPGFLVGVRLGASEAPGGASVADNQALLRRLEADALIDFVDVSMGDYFRMDSMVGALPIPAGYELASTARIASVATVPRILTGRFRTLEEAEQVLRAGQAELVSLVRAQIADPDLVRKTRAGRAYEVRPCIGCNQGCIGGLFRTGRMGCAVNPAVGAERALAEDTIGRTSQPRRVLVVGGGPAGMEAARAAALRGHAVTLVEARAALGGTIALAQRAPHLNGLGDITYWQEQELYRLGVEVRLGSPFDADDLRACGDDVVILATGSVPRLDGFQLADPGEPVQGCAAAHVLSSHDVLALAHDAALGRSALVLDTVGHCEALAVVELLLGRGLAVSYVSPATSLAPYLQTTWRDVPALERCHAAGGFEVLLRHQLLRIEPGHCVVRPRQASPTQVRRIAADTVVLVTQNAPQRALFDALRDELPSIQLVGDARSPRDLQAAIADGYLAGRAIA